MTNDQQMSLSYFDADEVAQVAENLASAAKANRLEVPIHHSRSSLGWVARDLSTTMSSLHQSCDRLTFLCQHLLETVHAVHEADRF